MSLLILIDLSVAFNTISISPSVCMFMGLFNNPDTRSGIRPLLDQWSSFEGSFSHFELFLDVQDRGAGEECLLPASTGKATVTLC